MNKTEALEVVKRELDRWRQLPWSALKERVGTSETTEIEGAGGTRYQVQIQAFWDANPESVIRVLGSVDDGVGGLSCPSPRTS